MIEYRDTAYGRVPLPAGIRSRMAANGNGLEMHFLEAGFEERGRPCALLLHGFPELAYSWRHVMPALAQAGFHVIAPDQRGYGRTTGWDPDYDGDLASYRLFNLVRDVMGLLDALGRTEVALLAGHDFGAPVAAWAALIRPDIFRKVALMSAPFPGPPDISPQPPPARSIHAELAALDRPRKHYQWYYSTREANADMRDCPQGVHAFLRAYFHHKSADWTGNRPFPLAAWSAGELARMPTYYIMDRDRTMAQTVAAEMPGEEGNRRLPLAAGCGARGLCAGVRAQRVPGRAAMVSLPHERSVRPGAGALLRAPHRGSGLLHRRRGRLGHPPGSRCPGGDARARRRLGRHLAGRRCRALGPAGAAGRGVGPADSSLRGAVEKAALATERIRTFGG